MKNAASLPGRAGLWAKTLSPSFATAGYERPAFVRHRHTQTELLARLRRAEADFVFHLAGVNRPQNPDEFYEGNRGFTEAPARPAGRGGQQSACARHLLHSGGAGQRLRQSKREAEELIFAHERATGAPALVYRLPGVFGKWCRPSYNSVVATFCHNIAHGLPIDVRDPAYTLSLWYTSTTWWTSFIARAWRARAATAVVHSRLLPSDVRRTV